MLRDLYRFSTADVARAFQIRRDRFLPEGRLALQWAAEAIDWAFRNLGPAEMKALKQRLDTAR